MGFGNSSADVKPSYTGVQVQTSASTLPVALAGGLTRLAPNLWDYTDFQSHEQKAGGKGFGGSATSFTYSATVLMGLCGGVISGVQRAWKDQGVEADFSTFGFTLFTGTIPQAHWGYMGAAHPERARGYPGGAYLAKANMDLGTTASLSSWSFEVEAPFYHTAAGGTLPDADPALWIQYLLTDEDKGAGFTGGLLDLTALLSGPDAATTGDSAHQTYCQAMGLGVSPGYVSQEPCSAMLDRLCTVTNSASAWTGDRLKVIPYGDTEVTANGVTYLPPTGVCCDLADDDFIQQGNSDPVRVSRSDPADAKNCVNLIVRDRANAYNEVPVPYQDDNAVTLYDKLPAADISGREVCDVAMAGRIIDLVGRRILYDRNQFSFMLGPRHDRLEPMDVVRLTDVRLGLTLAPVRILTIDEDAGDNLSITAVQFTGTVGHPSAAASGSGVTPTNINSLVAPSPVNPPSLFEPSATLAQRLFGSPAACVAAAVSGGDGTTADPNWGGCFVWISTDDATYQPIGQIDGPARMGKSTAILAAYGGANPDTGHTLSVDLSMSAGELAGASSADAAAGATLAYIDGEVVSFKDATLTGAHAYDLGGELYRGLYGTARGAHASGSAFARLDGALFKYDLPPAYVGVTLYLKFQSFNIWGQAVEDLAGCTAYTVTPTGVGFAGSSSGTGTPTPASVDIPAMSLVNIFNSGGPQLRLADATAAGKEAHAFVAESVASGASGIPQFRGAISNAAWALTPGLPVYLDTTAGGLTHVAPSASGNVVQPVGVATSATTVDFAYHPTADIIP